MLQSADPLLGRRTRIAWGDSRPKRGFEQFAERLRQVLQEQRRGRRIDERRRLVPGKREAAFGDRSFDRQVACSAIATGKRMSADEEQVENQRRQPEAIVVHRSDHVAQPLALQFGRRKVGRTDRAGVGLAVARDLERVAVDHSHAHLRIDQQVALVDVADDDPGRVQAC